MSRCRGLGSLVGGSPPMAEFFEQVADTAATDYGIMITAESCTGKKLAARTNKKLYKHGIENA